MRMVLAIAVSEVVTSGPWRLLIPKGLLVDIEASKDTAVEWVDHPCLKRRPRDHDFFEVAGRRQVS